MKNHADALIVSPTNVFVWQFVSERKQIAVMADEKLRTQFSHRLLATSRSEMRVKMNGNNDKEKRRKPKELNIQIGERCRQAREAAGYTQEALAEQIDVSTQFLSDAERGVTGMSISTIIKLCRVLGVSADFILLGQDTAEADSPFSIGSRIRRLSPQQQKLVEDGFNLLNKAFFTK